MEDGQNCGRRGACFAILANCCIFLCYVFVNFCQGLPTDFPLLTLDKKKCPLGVRLCGVRCPTTCDASSSAVTCPFTALRLSAALAAVADLDRAFSVGKMNFTSNSLHQDNLDRKDGE